MKNTMIFASLLAVAGLSTSAMAADTSSNWFLRGEAGNSKLSVNGFSGNDTSVGARGGYFFNPNFAIEGFYTDFGSSSNGGFSAKLDGFGAGLIGKMNFGPDNTGWFINARAGVLRSKAKVSLGSFHVSDSATKGYIGVGGGYDFTRNFGLSLNADYNGVDVFSQGGSLKTITLGAEVRF
jgi:hypothetical protein